MNDDGSDELRDRIARMTALGERLELHLAGANLLAESISGWLGQGEKLLAAINEWREASRQSFEQWNELRRELIAERDQSPDDWWKG